MATEHRSDARRFTNSPLVDTSSEPHLRDLLKQLASDSGELVRNEVALAKLEMREVAREISADGAQLGIAFAFALTGALALTAAATIALGNALDGNYALSAVIIGSVLLAVGAVLARKGIKGLRNGPRPHATKESLQRDRQFVRAEMQEFKQNIRA